MIRTALQWLAARLPSRRIEAEDGVLYLMRYKLFGWMPGDERRWPVSAYLHNFHSPDLDYAPHNHPWRWCLSLVLTGGYTEQRLDPESDYFGLAIRRLRPGAINVIRSRDFHRISELHGDVWTLFVVGPKASSWGFHVDGRGFVPFRERFAERGIPT